MVTRTLPHDPRFNLNSQAQVSTFAASLEDQTRRLMEALDGVGPDVLAWQPMPGHNTIGSLMAHMALVELAWVCFAANGKGRTPETAKAMNEVLGCMDAGGFLIKPEGPPPPKLNGKSLEFYRDYLARARIAVLDELETWSDASLDDMASVDDRSWSKRWILYHVLEHFAAHFGQIGKLLHDMRDAGMVLSKESV